MTKYKYVGAGERVFPSIGITVKSGEEFEAAEGFKAKNVVLANASSAFKAVPTAPKVEESKPSAASDQTVGE